MINRLRHFPFGFFCFVVAILSLLPSARLEAQASFFNFNYNGPDTLTVGASCNRALQGSIPNPVVTSTIGATIITSMFDAAASGFAFNDTWGPNETAHIYWYVQDNMGHSYTFEFFVAFVDKTPPVFDLTGVADTLYFGSVVAVTPPPVMLVTDNCNAVDTVLVEGPKPDTCAAGQFTRTWTATDAAGNTSVFTQTVIIAADTEPPTVTHFPQNGSAPCELLNTAYPAWLSAQFAAFSANDPSGIRSLTHNGPASFPPGCKVPLTVTFRATDNCNFIYPTTAVFTTSDTEGPVIIVEPKDTIAYCSVGGNHLQKINEWIHTHAYMQVYDSCSAPLAYTMLINGNAADSAAVVAAFNASFANSCGTQLVGSQVVNKVSALVRVDFFVKDDCGNQTFAGQAMFAAVDTLPPIITGINVTEQCGGGNDQAALQNWINAKGNATLSDDCSTPGWINFSFTTSSGQSGSGGFNAGPYPTIAANNCNWYADVTFHAGDECGNTSSKTLRFQIIDTQAPVFTGLSPNITVYCPNPLPTVPAATITDNCDAVPAITFSRIFQDSICDGSYTVVTTWQATDDCGNTSTAVQNIFVRDTTRPVFTLVPVGLLMRCDTFALPPDPVMGQNINATDLCSPVTNISTLTTSFQNPNPLLCSHYSYHFTRTFTATDECGNTQTATQLISVIDNQPPIPTGVLDTTALCSALMPFPAPAPTAFDLCGGQTPPPVYVNTETLPGSCTGQYTLKLNWIATDYCGNQTPFSQLVHVVDTVAPTLSNIPANITVECNHIPAPPNPAAFNGTDNCAPGVIIALQEIEIRNPDVHHCDHWTNYTLRRQWTASDACGNARTYTQNIQIEDTTPPILTPPAAITLPTDMDDCGATIPIPAPISVLDDCTSLGQAVVLKDTLSITPAPNPNNGSLSVDTLTFHFSVPNLPPNQPAIGAVSLTLYIESADIDGAMEFFRIYGENGVFIDVTTPTGGVQCSSTPYVKNLTISAAQFNDWAADGDLAVTLAPNLIAVNPVCPNSRARMDLSYTYAAPQVAVDVFYSLDGGPTLPYPPVGSTFLGVGAHTVVYTAKDCRGNTSTASLQIQVNDVQPPSMVAPAPLTAYAGADCKATVKLPFPVISENCEMSGHINRSSIAYPLSFISDPDAGVVPADVNMGIPGLIPNAISSGTLSIKFKGDNTDDREFFNIYYNTTQITTTKVDTLAVACQDTVITRLTVSAADINTWAATGTAILRAEANKDAGPNFNFDFINPCNPLLPNQTDGLSVIQAMLEYSYAIVNFTITQGNTIVATGALQGAQTMVPMLSPGNYTVKYTTTDKAGLMGMTSFPLVVRDTIKPTAKCKPSLIISVNPSGVNNYTLQPSEINNGSSDNCSGVLTYTLSQNTFSCNQAGNNYTVTLTVRDTSGNTATCTTVVSVQNAMPVPSYSSVCEGDTLFLFAHPPTPGLFSYSWTHTNFTSTVQNPVRLNAQPDFQGLYVVQITGATGCTATGSVTVNFANLTVPNLTVSGGSGTKFCQGQNVVLNTTTYPGNGVSYQWYSAAPSPVLLGTTTLPFFTINQPPPGNYSYFVKVKVGECLTPNSIIISVDVFARPPAMVEDDKVVVCTGEPIAFGTQVSGPGLTYLWSGPGWSGSPQTTQQFPLVTNSATTAFAGFHVLKTFQNGCESIPADTVEVVVKYTPPKPQIIGNTEVCVGADVTLTAVVGGPFAPTMYEWQDPSLNSLFDSTGNTLTIPDITASNCGNWRVRARYQGCYSEWSDLIGVCPQTYPDVTGSSNSPICQDSTLRLTATSSYPNLSWCWTLPDNSPIYLQNPVITPGQPGSYMLVGKTSYGCADTVIVTVQGSMAPVVDTIINTAPDCADGMIGADLIPSFTSANGPFTYIWTNSVGATISSQLILSFPVVTPAQNGPYTFVVKDQYGCPSAPKTATIDVQGQVPTPVLSIAPNPVCAGNPVTLSVAGTFTGNPQYHWLDPNGNAVITLGSQLLLPAITVDQAGTYKMYVSQGACLSAFSNEVSLVVNPVPVTPEATSNSPVCIGNDLELDATFIPGATYFWTGPFGFNQTGRNLVRMNATAAFEGDYILHVEVNQCASANDTVKVDIMSVPTTPVIGPETPEPICIEQFPIAGFIKVTDATRTLGAQYTWTDASTGNTIYGPTTDHVLYFSNLDASLLTPGDHFFQVAAFGTANGDQCSSMKSPVYKVRFDTIPNNNAECFPDGPACVNAPVLLRAVHPSGGITGQWNQVPLPTVAITNRDSSTARFQGIAGASYSFVWSLSSGGCKNFSTDTLKINVVAPDTAHAGVDIFLCSTNEVQLNAVQGKYANGVWSQLNQNEITIEDVNDPHTAINGMLRGNSYFFTWTLPDIGCGVSVDVVNVKCYSSDPIITGQDFVCAGENCALVETGGFQMGWETGAWSSPDATLVFQSPNNNSTTVCNLKPSDNVIIFTLDSAVCGNRFIDTFYIRYEMIPVLVPDVYETDFGDTVHIRALDNDALPAVVTEAEIQTDPSHGTATPTNENGVFIYKPDPGFSGEDEFTYQICNDNCKSTSCRSTTVTVIVREAGDCFVPNVITPNNDDLNDAFRLPPECYTFGEGETTIEVTIFNQWGDFVYHRKPFVQNVDAWDGTKDGQELPAGTYFYVVKREGDPKVKTGFLLLQR